MTMPLEIHEHQLEFLLARAEKNGIGEQFNLLHETALKLGFYPRLYRHSVMYAPPNNRTRCLICAWVEPKKGKLRIYLASGAIDEFYPYLSLDRILNLLGKSRWDAFDLEDTIAFCHRLDELFA